VRVRDDVDHGRFAGRDRARHRRARR
jgi:hypothetical protein